MWGELGKDADRKLVFLHDVVYSWVVREAGEESKGRGGIRKVGEGCQLMEPVVTGYPVWGCCRSHLSIPGGLKHNTGHSGILDPTHFCWCLQCSLP